MSTKLPTVYLARHGETAWTLSGKHTGREDLPLTERGERNARNLGVRLHGLSFSKVWTSPLRRTMRTCELAGYAAVVRKDPDLLEWDYGKYEGLRRDQILADAPGWNVFRDGGPGGENPRQAADRADRVVQRVRAEPGDVLLFSSGHFLRVLAARWLGLETTAARYFLLGTASLSALTYDHGLDEPAIRFWNDTQHVEP